jgi:fimbrial chaperone protein
LARESSAAVNVENTGDSTMVVQVRVQSWMQRDGKDVREDTRDIVVNPPIFKLGRGEQQLVRFASRAAPPRDNERAYRVVFQEVPPRDSFVGEGLRFAVAMDIPVYVEPATAGPAPPLRYEARRTADGLRVRIFNPGTIHRRLGEPELTAGGKPLAKPATIVVLAQSSVDVVAPLPAPDAATIQLVATDGEQKIAIDLSLAP